MIDFSKKLGANALAKKTDPVEIYDLLDRASDKGPLRPAQHNVLKNWFDNYRTKKDVIIKLHTGQGKTLIGLLLLQSRLNEGKGPSLYLCPNKYLVEQTCEQAKQFGVKYCHIDTNNNIPHEFWENKSILIAHVQLLFNGKTKFGLKNSSLPVGSIVLDDSHACIDTIQEAFTIRIKKEHNVFEKLLTLFDADLEGQGLAKLEEIKLGEYEALLPVPYWAWQEKYKDVVSILVEKKADYQFSWELVKDVIQDCQCVFSGSGVEITPYRNPIEQFGSFYKASHRVFMSATTNNDSFFIKGLDLSIDTIRKPIKYDLEKWSGEKMILIPYLFNYSTNRNDIVNTFAKPNPSRKYGIVGLTPSQYFSKLWQICGATVSESIETQIKLLKEQRYENTIVFSNRYDGIDLADDMCRILILDSKPYATTLIDRYHESCRTNSKVTDVKIAQKIEQGLGRAVRGEKDYCCILLIGDELIKNFRTKSLNQYFSAQTNKQIEIGLETIEFAVKETGITDDYIALKELINLVINRDENWKKFYKEKMDLIEPNKEDNDLLELFELEKKAEEKYRDGEPEAAVKHIQSIIDKHLGGDNKDERGWYLQEMARYLYNESKIKSNDLQLSAYKINRYLLKPTQGVQFQKLKLNKSRLENIKNWISKFDSYEELKLEVNDILGKLSFGVKADKFEQGINNLGEALGFASERPDKEHKKGPDNLWNVRASEYILFECKNEVDENRAEINKHETGQMNVSCAWFKDNYAGETVKNIMVIPTKNISAHGAFSQEVEILNKRGLKKLNNNVDRFFKEFKDFDIHTLTDQQIDSFLVAHTLTVENILNEYTIKPYQLR
ncbi:DEAD/DEAH box helicase [Spirosoma oryzicola]|uniref:DEAD/DEAH box helicase n=1 Tax=Spirosoma oryzicola TaxID=2898794 RepID=UPI001E28BF91|nr:DEAD/DEAH box helicase family protein [Spirosoma oryzicola]UHG94670.1 DEAD/DEAH box helicase family protein [Spirosoma oryzicola]